MAIGIQSQYFGTEIEMTGITRQRAAEAVAELFGTRAVYDWRILSNMVCDGPRREKMEVYV